MVLVSVSSSKGGSGKSTTAINLGVALAQLGKDVTVIDANLSTPNLSMYLGAPNLPITLQHVLQGQAHIHEATYQHVSGAKIIPASISMRNFEEVNLADLQNHLPHVKSEFVILDGAAGIDAEAQAPIQMSDQVLVVASPELPSVADALKTVRIAQHHGKHVRGVVLTRAGHHLDLKIKNVETILEHSVIGVIPEDRMIKASLVKREPVVHVFPQAPSAVAYKRLAAYFAGHPEFLANDEIPKIYKAMRWLIGLR
ncbi:MAG TPA: cell division ATPase MinD [Candidatus Nanoarchaeia archaeon]|nr:cell division ATPase MinD [Candidatus Nanoarchaeia archaeon]